MDIPVTNKTFDFFNSIFESKKDIVSSNNNKYTYDDFDYIVLQISHIFRNDFEFEYNGKIHNTNLDPRHERNEPDNSFYKWYDSNNITEDIWKDMFIKQQVEKIHKKIEFYEEYNSYPIFIRFMRKC